MFVGNYSKQKPNRRGAATVEFAVVLPIFLMIVFGIIEFGRAMMVQEILVNAARVGARQATLPNQTDSGVINTTANYLTVNSITGTSVSLSPSLSTNPTPGTALTVTVKVPFSSVSWLGTATWLNNKTLSANVVMMKE